MPKKTFPADPDERYAHREGDSDGLRQHVNFLIDELIELREETGPDDGPVTAKLKDIHSFHALETVGKIVTALAGWAVDHSLGRASRGLGFVPLVPSPVGKLPDYEDAREAADSHENELIGRELWSDGGIANDPAKERLVLIDHLRANPGGLPGDLARRFMEALEALEYGDVHPLLKPKTTDLTKPAYLRMMLQLQALAFIEYRFARGTKRVIAQEEVADAYGCAPATVRSWGPTLRKNIDRLKIASFIAFARNAGTYPTPAARRNAPSYLVKHRERAYGDDALSEAGERYKKARGFHT